jgi:transposase
MRSLPKHALTAATATALVVSPLHHKPTGNTCWLAQHGIESSGRLGHHRWVVECTFGWLSRKRRMSKDYERTVHTSETPIDLAMIRLLVARLGGRTS